MRDSYADLMRFILGPAAAGSLVEDRRPPVATPDRAEPRLPRDGYLVLVEALTGRPVDLASVAPKAPPTSNDDYAKLIDAVTR